MLYNTKICKKISVVKMSTKTNTQTLTCSWCGGESHDVVAFYVAWKEKSIVLCKSCQNKLDKMTKKERKSKINKIINEGG